MQSRIADCRIFRERKKYGKSLVFGPQRDAHACTGSFFDHPRTGGTDPLAGFWGGFGGAGGRWEGGHDLWLLATWLLATWLLATWLCRSVQLADAPHSPLPPASRGPADISLEY